MQRRSKAEGSSPNDARREDKRQSTKKKNWLGSFALSVIFGIPVFAALVPPAIISAVLARLFRKASKPIEDDNSSKPAATITPPESRELQLVLFGATGFTGHLAAVYLAKQYGNTVRWAIAGRRESALLEIRKELVAIDASLQNLPLILADADDDAALNKLAARTAVVISTAGPFRKYGTKLLRACVNHGTGYCDTTGEIDWVREMIAAYDQTARKTGARIVPLCGNDCIPWDLLALHLTDKLKSKDEEVVSFNFYDDIRAAASGGTLETVRLALTEPRTTPRSSFDPLVSNLAGSKSEYSTRAANQAFLGYSSEARSWVGPFIMAPVMADCIRRSNALLGYGKRVTYKEALTYPGFMAGFSQFLGLLLFGTALVFPLSRWLAYKYLLPKPGQGPSTATMDRGYLHISGTARGSKGSVVRGSFFINDDPGYRDTARMLVEAGLTLALESREVDAEMAELGKGLGISGKGLGGVLTPASCQGRALIRRLQRTGTVFE